MILYNFRTKYYYNLQFEGFSVQDFVEYYITNQVPGLHIKFFIYDNFHVRMLKVANIVVN